MTEEWDSDTPPQWLLDYYRAATPKQVQIIMSFLVLNQTGRTARALIHEARGFPFVLSTLREYMEIVAANDVPRRQKHARKVLALLPPKEVQ